MPHRIYGVFLFLLALCSLGRTGAEEAATVSLYDVRRISQPPVIDGKLDDACWQGAPVITNMVLRGAKTRVPAKVQTRTTVLYDDDAIYVGIHMDEPNPAGLVKNLKEYDGPLWCDDSVELYLETGVTHQQYFKLMSTPIATRADWRHENTPVGFMGFDWGTGAEWTVAAHVGEDFWSLEFRIPWSDLETGVPSPGTIWTFEIVRFRYANANLEKRGSEYSSWNVGAFYNAPKKFGNIVFSGATSEMERMFVEKLKPVYGTPFRIYGTEGEIRYIDYATLAALRRLQIANAIKDIRGKWERLEQLAPANTLKKMDEALTALETGLAETEGKAADASLSETLEKLAERIPPLEWEVRYQELNDSLVSAAPTEQNR